MTMVVTMFDKSKHFTIGPLPTFTTPHLDLFDHRPPLTSHYTPTILDRLGKDITSPRLERPASEGDMAVFYYFFFARR